MSFADTTALPVAGCAHPQDCAYLQELDELPLPCLDIDALGHITYANRAALALHHPDAGNLVGKSIWEFVAFDEKELSRTAFLAQMQMGGAPPVITRNIFDRSGSFRTYQLHRTLLRDSQGKPAGIRLVGVDVTEATRALEEARRTAKWLESAMASMRDALILTDTLGIVRSVNPAAGELVGRAAQELIGMTMEEAFPVRDGQPAAGATLDHSIALEQHWRGAATVLNSAGEKTKIEIGTSPIVDIDNGSVSGIVAILRKVDAAE